MRSLILVCLSASLCWAQTPSSGPTLVGAGFSNPFPLLVAPGQLLTLFVLPPAAYDTTGPMPNMPSISAVFWNGSDEAMPVLQVKQANTGCVVPSSSGVCPSLLAVTVQVPFDAPISPAAGSNIVVRPSGIAVFVSGEKSAYFGAQTLADQVHILTACDVLLLASPLPPNTVGLPCAPMITHADGSQVSIDSPAVAGEELVAYATGLGQTNPPLTMGQPAAASNPTVATFNLDFNYRPNALGDKAAAQRRRAVVCRRHPRLRRSISNQFHRAATSRWVAAVRLLWRNAELRQRRLLKSDRQRRFDVFLRWRGHLRHRLLVPDDKRLLLIGATTGYQTRVFAEAAERLGYELVLATDRCHVLDDPWGDRAIALRFEDPPGAAATLAAKRALMASSRWAIARLTSRRSRPSAWASRTIRPIR